MATAPDAFLLGLARALRAAGLPVTPDRETAYLQAVAVVGLDDGPATYWAGRATLCTGPDDTARYDEVFTAWFAGHGVERVPPRPAVSVAQASLDDDPGPSGAADGGLVLRATASATEVLRHRDVGGLSATEKALAATLFASLLRPAPQRRGRRHTRWHRGQLDAHRSLRRQVERLGEPGPLHWRRRGVRGRRIVLLVDVSGSMSAYADSLLRLAHHWSGGGVPVEVFTMGTRLTHVTRAIRRREPDEALAAAGSTVPDWSGGTRLGESLKAFVDRWGQRGMARGAVVVVFSDGWERGEVDLLEEQMRRLRGLAHRVVWVNPHRGKEGYQAVQQGILAVLPHCHDFLAGHSLHTFDELGAVVDRA